MNLVFPIFLVFTGLAIIAMCLLFGAEVIKDHKSKEDRFYTLAMIILAIYLCGLGVFLIVVGLIIA